MSSTSEGENIIARG